MPAQNSYYQYYTNKANNTSYLEARLDQLRTFLARMKKANNIIRNMPTNMWLNELIKSGFTEMYAQSIVDNIGDRKLPFSPYDFARVHAEGRWVYSNLETIKSMVQTTDI